MRLCLSSGSVSLVEPRPDGGEVPRQQFMDLFQWMLSDPFQHLAQIFLGIEAIQFSGLGQRVDRGSPLAAGVRSGEQPILAVMHIYP